MYDGKLPCPSPKLSIHEKRSSIYPYYAGYSPAFVAHFLHTMGLRPGSVILDPWNGGGTTTQVAAQNNFCSIGIDLNPALTIVARAKLAQVNDIENLERHLARISAKCLPSSATALSHLTAYYTHTTDKSKKLSEKSHSLLLCGMFVAARALFHAARTRNPTWYNLTSAVTSKLDRQVAFATIHHWVCKTLDLQRIQAPSHACPALLRTDDFLKSRIDQDSIDAVITSPPYLTRIDYVKATLPELVFLSSIEEEIPLQQLRAHMMGTPVIAKGSYSETTSLGAYTLSLLDQIRHHKSKASHSYYYRFYLQYFSQLQASIQKIARCLRRHGTAVLVVQTSQFKEIYIDLPSAITDMALIAGLESQIRLDFAQRRSMIHVNTRAAGATATNIVESAVVMTRS